MQLTRICSVSTQVLRALKPPLTADMCSTLLLCLQQCLAAAPTSAVAREVALELLLTVRSLLEVLPARKLLLYPQASIAVVNGPCTASCPQTIGPRH